SHMTDAKLQGYAAQALSLLKTDFDLGRSEPFLFAYVLDDNSRLRRVRNLEATMVQRAGRDWLDHRDKKAQVYGFLRLCTSLAQPEAVITANFIKMFLPTEKLRPLGQEVLMKPVTAPSHHDHYRAVAEGLLAVHEALMALAQTKDRVCVYTHQCEKGQFDGKP